MSSNGTESTSSPSFPPTSSIPTSSPTTDSPTTFPPTTTDVTTTTTEPPPPPTTTTTTPIPTTTTTTTTSTTPSTTVVTSSTTVISTTIVTTETTITVPPTTSSPPPTTVVTVTTITDPTTTQSSTTTRSTSPSATIISPSGQNSGGLGTPGTIAIAVIIPVVVVALLLVLGFFLWRKRKARKLAEEQRKNEMAEYGFNPNNDPSLFPAAAAAPYTDGHSEAADDNSGYRGWGTTNSNARRPSTTLGSNGRGAVMGMGLSESGSQPGGYGQSPQPNAMPQEPHPSDPLMGSQEHTDGVAALGGAAVVKNNRNSEADIQRGVSNASSSYSRGAPQSESSAEVPYGSPQYHEDVPYNVYSGGATQAPYGDGTYANDNPVIRDVSARRNTKIERAPTFPQTQGGISQNF